MRGQRAWHRATSARWGAAMRGGAEANLKKKKFVSSIQIRDLMQYGNNCIDQIRALALIPLLGNNGVGSGSRLRGRSGKQNFPGDDQYNKIQTQYEPFIGCLVSYLAGILAPGSDQFHEETGTSRSRTPQNPLPMLKTLSSVSVRESLIQYLCDPQWFRDTASRGPHNHCGSRITIPDLPIGSCVQYGPFNPYIPIRSTTIGKSRVAIDPIAMRTSWRSNSDIASVTSIGYPCMSASGESSTTMHRLLHASGPHQIPPPNDPK
ncbi:hypothetical protein F511_02127 [Dorcoceras hygrometricum]|nr:hypothetical protein F511_02127 [Dorcoceras hygrometricum]